MAIHFTQGSHEVGRSLGTWFLHFSAPRGSLSLSFSVCSKPQCSSTRASTHVLLPAVVLDLQCEVWTRGICSPGARWSQELSEGPSQPWDLCPVERRPPLPEAPVCCCCEWEWTPRGQIFRCFWKTQKSSRSVTRSLKYCANTTVCDLFIIPFWRPCCVPNEGQWH